MSIKVFYHSRDFDGICSAAILYHNPYYDKLDPDFYKTGDFIGIDYGDIFPFDKITEEDDVIMMDFSLPFDGMWKLLEGCRRFCWIDHHESSIKEMSSDPDLMNLLGGVRNTEFSGCELTWQFFYGSEPMPESVHMLGRYDLFKFDLKAKQFQLGMKCLPDSIRNPKDKMWKKLIYDEAGSKKLIEKIIKDGKTVTSYSENHARFTIEKTGMVINYKGLRILCANACNFSSTLFEFLYDPFKHDAMMSYYFKDGTWRFGLYSTKPEIELLAIAKEFGGGGHPQACGMSLDKDTFNKTFAKALGMI